MTLITPHQARLLEQANAELRAELAAAHEEIAALKQHRDQYATTKRFHERSFIDDLPVTPEEDEAFAVLAKRLDRVESAYMLQHGRINTMNDKLDAIREVL